MLPRLVIDLEKLRHNACTLCAMTRERGISALAFVTKVFCADREMVRVLAQTPCRYLADSRIENLARCEGLGKERILALTGGERGAQCGDQLQFRTGHSARAQYRRWQARAGT